MKRVGTYFFYWSETTEKREIKRKVQRNRDTKERVVKRESKKGRKQEMVERERRDAIYY